MVIKFYTIHKTKRTSANHNQVYIFTKDFIHRIVYRSETSTTNTHATFLQSCLLDLRLIIQFNFLKYLKNKDIEHTYLITWKHLLTTNDDPFSLIDEENAKNSALQNHAGCITFFFYHYIDVKIKHNHRISFLLNHFSHPTTDRIFENSMIN